MPPVCTCFLCRATNNKRQYNKLNVIDCQQNQAYIRICTCASVCVRVCACLRAYTNERYDTHRSCRVQRTTLTSTLNFKAISSFGLVNKPPPPPNPTTPEIYVSFFSLFFLFFFFFSFLVTALSLRGRYTGRSSALFREEILQRHRTDFRPGTFTSDRISSSRATIVKRRRVIAFFVKRKKEKKWIRRAESLENILSDVARNSWNVSTFQRGNFECFNVCMELFKRIIEFVEQLGTTDRFLLIQRIAFGMLDQFELFSIGRPEEEEERILVTRRNWLLNFHFDRWSLFISSPAASKSLRRSLSFPR